MSSRRWHTGLGVVLGVYVCLHAFRELAALDSREAWLERGQRVGLGPGLGLVVVALFVAYAFFRVRSWRQSERGLVDNFQLVTGALVGAFLVGHLLQVAPFALLTGSRAYTNALDPYDRLWTGLGQPAALLAYIVGATALAFHFGTGLVLRAPSRPRALRYVAGLGGLLLWLAYLQVVARFAIGEGLIPTDDSLAPQGAAIERDGVRPPH